MNPEEVLPPDTLTPPTPPTPIPLAPIADPNPTSVLCEFCQCKITTARGQVLDRSPKALAYLETDLVLRELRRDLLAGQKREEGLREQLNALTARNPSKLGL